ncbi:MAG: ATP-dependent nuclease subunit B [Ruminococcaceae bacterium]|nr:ATP-dependent nuclease subunit B [Oscillospiraceae bacterium]
MLKLILGRAKSGKTAAIMDAVRSRVQQGLDRTVLLIPEQYSHEAESELLRVCGDKLCLYAEVLSFTRLAARVDAETGCAARSVLDKGGRLLCLVRALDAVGSRLRVCAGARRQPELQQLLLQAIDECKSACITPDTLADYAEGRAGDLLPGRTDALREKLGDLALVYGAYEAIAAQSGLDPMDKLSLLAERLPASAYARGCFFIDGFTDFTAQESQVIATLLRTGADVTICLTTDGLEESHEIFEPSRRAALKLLRLAESLGCEAKTEIMPVRGGDSPMDVLERELFAFGSASCNAQGNISLLCAPDITSECEAAAAKCLALVRETGCRWRDIAVAARSYDTYRAALESIFPHYGIPLFSARNSDLTEKPLISLIRSAYDIIGGGWDLDDILTYLKTGLAGLSREECDELENYAYLWSLHGSAWTKAENWTLHPDGFTGEYTEQTREKLQRVNALRRRVCAPLTALAEAGGAADTATGQAQALAAFFDTLRLPELLDTHARALRRSGMANRAAEYAQLWEIIVGALEQSAAILGDTPMDTETFGKLFCTMLSAYDIGSIPMSLDRVSAGDMNRMRRRNIRHLIVLGCDSANLPLAGESAAIFSDADRETLLSAGLELGSTGGDRLNREFSLIYNCLTLPEETLHLSWCASGGEGGKAIPAFVVSRAQAVFGLQIETPDTDDCRSHAPAPAFELAAAAVDRSDASPLRVAALDYFRAQNREEELRRLFSAAHLSRGSLSRSAVRALYGDTLRLSASRLEKFAGCRFAYFLQYGLKAKPRAKLEFTAPEYGTFLHYILEHVARDIAESGGFAAAAPETVDALCDRYVTAYVHEKLNDFSEKSPRFIYLFKRLTKSVRAVVGDMAAELAKSDFVPLDFELDFGAKENFPPLRLGEGEDSLVLTGVADRVDGYVHNGRLYVRVMDYKTGRKSFSLSDVWYGMGLQMLLYLFALQRSGSERYGHEIVPAGVLYVPARDVLVSARADISAEEILAEKAKARRRSGLLLADEEILHAMEHGETPQYLPVKLNRDGAFRDDSLATAERLGLLSRHIDETLQALAKQLRGGSIAADPWARGQSARACDLCDYRGACHFDENTDQIRYLAKLKDDEVWSRLEAGKEARS